MEQVSYATYRQVVAALKFLHRTTLGQEWEASRIPFPKHRRPALPGVLRDDQLLAFAMPGVGQSRCLHDSISRNRRIRPTTGTTVSWPLLPKYQFPE